MRSVFFIVLLEIEYRFLGYAQGTEEGGCCGESGRALKNSKLGIYFSEFLNEIYLLCKGFSAAANVFPCESEATAT